MNFSCKTITLALLLCLSAYQLTAQNEALKILANGNVGIGTSDPKTTLEVNGTVKANSFILGVNRTNSLYPLDVHGIINTDSAIYINGIAVLRTDDRNNNFIGKLAGAFGQTIGEDNTFVGRASGMIAGTALTGNTAIGTGARTESCNYAVALGFGSVANADYSTAIGAYAVATDENTIRLGDPNVTGIFASVGITVTSDKNRKEKIYPVNKENILNKLINIPITSWNLKGQDPKKFRHYGPMAQDFYAAFGKDKYGTIGNNTTINSQDIEGINMIAIQALAARIHKLTVQNGALKKQLNKLLIVENENALLKTSVSQLKLSVVKQQDLLNKLLEKLDLVALKKESSHAAAVK